MNVIDTGTPCAASHAPSAGPEPDDGAQVSRPQSPKGLVQKLIPGALLVPIHLVERDAAQPRRDWKHSEGMRRLEELTQSVREFGILQPLLVRQVGSRYVVIAGGRRLVAARRAGLTEIPVVVREADSVTVRIMQLLENLQRHELSPTDEARAYQELMELQGLTPPKIALRVRRHEQHVRDRLRLLRDQVLSDAVERRQISATVAREINKLPDEIAEQLRRRVQEGARLQQKDIDEVRGQMAREGIVHPRLAPRADRAPGAALGEAEAESSAESESSTEEVHLPMLAGDRTDAQGAPVPPPPAAETTLPRWLDGDRQRTVRSDKAAFHRIQQDYQRFRASTLAGDTPPATLGAAPTTAAKPPELPREAPEQALIPTEAPAAPGSTLTELIAGLDLTRLQQLLLYGIERGMSCAGLWQQILTLSGPNHLR